MNLLVNQVHKYKDIQKELLIDKFSTQFAYGQREILLNYCELDETSLLIGILQHGVGPTFTFSSDLPTPRAGGLRRSRLWVYSKEAARELSTAGATNVFPIGSPWLYSKALDLYDSKKTSPKIKFLVFSRHHNFTNWSKNPSVDILEKITYWKSIAGSEDLEICLYWTEFIDTTWQKVAREEGVVLVCAGLSSADPVWSQSRQRINFFKNLREIMDSATHCIFESFTSAIFYANDLKKNVGIYHTKSELELLRRDAACQKENAWLLQNIPGIFNTCGSSAVLDSITYKLLGYDDLLSPENLSQILRYRTGIIPKQ